MMLISVFDQRLSALRLHIEMAVELFAAGGCIGRWGRRRRFVLIGCGLILPTGVLLVLIGCLMLRQAAVDAELIAGVELIVLLEGEHVGFDEVLNPLGIARGLMAHALALSRDLLRL